MVYGAHMLLHSQLHDYYFVHLIMYIRENTQNN